MEKWRLLSSASLLAIQDGVARTQANDGKKNSRHRQLSLAAGLQESQA